MTTKQIKVLEVNKLYFPVTGGIERIVQQIAEGLNGRVTVEVLVCQKKGRGVTETVNGVKVVRAGSIGTLFSLPISPTFIWRLRKMSMTADIIHFHVPFPLGDLACLMASYKGKVVVSWHSDIVRQKKMMKLYKPLMKKFLSRADVILVSTQGHIEGSDYLWEYREKCRIVPYGLEPHIEKIADRYIADEGAKSLSSGNKPTRFLFIGRLVYYKGCEVLVEAFSKVSNAELWLVGTGPLEESLKLRVAELGISEKVVFKGSLPDDEMAECIWSCDALVLPSIIKSEAFGLVQLEAMIFEKPVINTSLPSGVPYVSLDKETGITVEPKSAEQLTLAMQWLVNHEHERKVMGQKGRQRVKKYFTTANMLDNIEKVYKELLDVK